MGACEEALQIVSANRVEAAHAFVCQPKPGGSAERASKRPWCSCRNSARRGSLWQQCANALVCIAFVIGYTYICPWSSKQLH